MSGTVLANNNAASTLAGAITNTATTANLASGTGVLFPAPTGSNYFCLTFNDAATGLLREIVHVTNVTADTITMVRAQEGTTALNWLAGDLALNLFTAGTFNALVQQPAFTTLQSSVTAIQANIRTRLTSNTTYYVSTTGSDVTGTGAVGNPWATIQHALLIISTTIDDGGFAISVSVANGAYSGPVFVPPMYGGPNNAAVLNIIGNTGSPSSVTLTSTNASGFVFLGAGSYTIQGFTIAASGTGSGQGVGINAASGPIINVQNVTLNACGIAGLLATQGAQVSCSTGITFGGSMPIGAYSYNQGGITFGGSTITVTSTPAFSTAFAVSTGVSLIAFLSGASVSGSATGSRYQVTTNSVIVSGGLTLPGNAAGTTATGGQYV